MAEEDKVKRPDEADLRRLSADLHLDIPDSEISSYKELIDYILKNSYDVIDKYGDVVLPVKYPRDEVVFPSQDENPFNGWYCKCEISGAPYGILKGYKVAIKDSIPVAGVPMMNGSKVFEGYVPDYDPTVVTRILDAGGTISGKATCEDNCDSGCSFTSKPRPVMNPHDPTRTSGGSSSGSAVLVQTKAVDMALGGDQGGSIRIPSSWTGIVGHKPTYGLVPYTGIAAMAVCVDHVGPMARTVKECALLLEAIAGFDDGRDARQISIPNACDLPKYSQLLSGDVFGLKIGVLQEGFEGCEEDIAKLVREAAISISNAGATVEDVSIPMHKDGSNIALPYILEGSYICMVKSQGFPVGPPSFYPVSAINSFFASIGSRSGAYPPTVKKTCLVSKFIQDNYGMRFYAKSANLARVLGQKYDEALDIYDVLVMPTLKYKAPKLPDVSKLSIFDYVKTATGMTANTFPYNTTGHPATSINAGYLGGLPVGMMIVGRHLADDKVLNVAYAYEQKLKQNKPL